MPERASARGPFALLLTIAALWAIVRASATDGSGRWAIAAVLFFAATLFALSLAAVLVAPLALVVGRRPRSWLRPGVAAAVCTIGVLAYLIGLNHSRAWSLDWLASPTLDTIRDQLWLAAGRTPVAAAAAAVGVATVALGWTRGGGRARAAFLLAWAAAPIGATLLVSLWRPAFSAEYLLPTLPAVALLAGAAAAAAHRQVATLAAVLVVAGCAYPVVDSAHAEPSADWRAAARFVAANDRADDTVLVAPGRATAAFLYYTPDARVHAATQDETLWVVAAAPTRRRQVLIGRIAAGAPDYVLVSRREFGPGLMVQRWVRAASRTDARGAADGGSLR